MPECALLMLFICFFRGTPLKILGLTPIFFLFHTVEEENNKLNSYLDRMSDNIDPVFFFFVIAVYVIIVIGVHVIIELPLTAKWFVLLHEGVGFFILLNI